MISVSDDDWNRLPVSTSDDRRRAALVRLPLWARAKPPKANTDEKGCISNSAFEFPLVE